MACRGVYPPHRQAYQKLDQVRVGVPFEGDESQLGPGDEVLVQMRQYTHNESGTFHEFTLGQVVEMDEDDMESLERDAAAENR
jgi:hypothetical protein